MNAFGANGNGFNVGGRGPSNAIAYPNLAQLFGPDQNKINATISKIRSNLATWSTNQVAKGGAVDAKALEEIYKIQASLIIDKNGAHFSCLSPS